MRARGGLQKARDWARLVGSGRPNGGTVATSIDLCLNPTLSALLGASPALASRLGIPDHQTVVGWGRRPSGRRAERIAAKRGSRLLLLEDGFLRSIGRGDAPIALAFDDTGIYYDSTRPSRLEALIPLPLGDAARGRARSLADLWRSNGVSKYNDARDYSGDLPDDYVLVTDQVAGDLSVRLGGADGAAFDRMLSAALTDDRSREVVVKVHPDALSRRRSGHFDPAALAGLPRVTVITEACHPVRLIRNARAVYTVTSQVGFEALIWGVPVVTFGAPFYSGWGLTEDRAATPARRGKATVEQLVHAALVGYPRYVDPETGNETSAEAAIASVGALRHQWRNDPESVYALGFSAWKRPALQRFLPASRITHVSDPTRIPHGSAVAVWGAAKGQRLPAPSRVMRVEDGFLRSAGLGADLVQPLSWVIDDLGLHYDATQPSRLERLLSQAEFTPDLVARASALRETIRRHGLSKYNLGGRGWLRPASAGQVILVAGQVESDASLRHGSPVVTRNVDLLTAVRASAPRAHIVYKPHPDVVAGLRRRGHGEDSARRIADTVLTDANLAPLLGEVDEVHVMTSLLGFEALLRGLPVTVHGQPFYAGWGLTRDLCPVPRRTRRLTLDELIACALILYPRYVSRRTGRLTTPERVVAELSDWAAAPGDRSAALRLSLRGLLRLWRASGLKRNA